MSDCCKTTVASAPRASAALICPRCGGDGKTVSLRTLKHQVRSEHLAAVEDGVFAFCATPECPAVYFNSAGSTFLLDDVRQRPTVKGGENPQLCYCFGFDTAMVRAEVAATGGCTVPQRIAAEMKADRCACEIRNPQGSCCFVNVNGAVRRELAAIRPVVG